MVKPIEQQSEFALYLTRALENVGDRYTQMEVAQLLGFKQPSILSIMKKGKSKMPLDKIAPLAKILGVDRGRLFRLALTQYHEGEALKNIIECFGDLPPDEEELLRKYRATKAAAGNELATGKQPTSSDV